MLRILHLLDPHDGCEPMLACRAAMSIAEVHHEFWLVTDSCVERAAAAFGFESTDRIGTLLGRAESAGPGLRTLLEQRTDVCGEPIPDLVQCWSVRMLGAARAAFGKRIIPRCAVLVRPPGAEVVRRSRATRYSNTFEERALDDTTLLALDRSTRDGWAPMASAGRGALRMRDNIRISPAPPLPLTSTTTRRSDARRALGLDDRDIAVVLLADPPDAGDSMRFAFQIGLQHVGGVRIVGIVPRGTTNARRGARFVASHGRRWGLIESSRPLDQLIGAADVALWDVLEDGQVSSGPAMLAACVAKGVTVAAAANPISIQLLATVPECIARDSSTRAVAGKLFELASDAPARANISARMASSAADMHARDAFRRTLLELWRERANVPTIRPGLPFPADLTGTGA